MGCQSIPNAAHNAQGIPNLSMSANLVQHEGLHILKMTLRNNGNNTLIMDKSALPWGNAYSMIVIGYIRSLIPIMLEQCFPIDDHHSDKIIFPPHSSLKGDIYLENRFQDFSTKLQQNVILVFWSYTFQHSLTIYSKPIFGGGFSIEQNENGTSIITPICVPAHRSLEGVMVRGIRWGMTKKLRR